MKLSQKLNRIIFTILLLSILSVSQLIITNNPLQPSTLINTNSLVVERLGVTLQRQPLYAFPGIITDFLIQPAFSYTQDELQNMFEYVFSDTSLMPPRIFLTQGQNPSQIRVMFDYQNNIPYKAFKVDFRINDNKNNLSGKISIVYNSITGGIKSAIYLNDKRTDRLK